MNEEELKEALVRAGRIIDHWEKQELDSNEAMELLAPLLKTITAHVERVLDPAAAISDPNLESEETSPGAAEVEKEELKESEEGDLFSKSESEEEEKEDVEEEKSKSKKKPKEFAGSDGSIPF